MKDPLRNNKIKSTKKQKIKVANQGPQKQSKIPVVGVVILVLVLVWIGYRIYQQNLNPQNQESNQPTQESQQQTINNLKQSAPQLEPAERQRKINTLFAN